MNYESMSDFEINKAAFLLAAKLGLLDFEDVMQNKNPDSDAVMYGDGANWHAWDGCNDPADAWPVISESKISIEYRDHKSLAPVAKRFGSNSHNISHENPLRAAMIVFLMMQND